MRVRISYGLDIEKVPNTIQNLIYESIEALKQSIDILERASDDLEEPEESAERALESLDRSRKKLSEVDLTISDCHSLVGGLVGYYKNGEEDVSDRRPVVDTSGDIADPPTNTGE